MIPGEPGELLYQMGYDGVLDFFYDPEENTFYDECGIRVPNILEILTPNDIFLFRQDPRNNVFPYREDRNILCHIIVQHDSSSRGKLALCYIEEDNVFIDGEGEVVFEIYDIITPNDLFLFKRNRRYAIVNHSAVPGMLVELYWPEPSYEDYRFRDFGG